MDEGSSEVDNGNFPSKEDETGSEESIEVRDEGGVSKDKTGADQGKSKDDGEGDEDVTDKGTKLDKDPVTAAHQLLANERKVRLQYENVLKDPELLKKYAKEAGISLVEAKAEIKEEAKTFSPDRFKTREDVANALNEMQSGFTKTVSELREENKRLQVEVSGFRGSSRAERLVSTMKADIDSVREKYPELDPKSPDFDKDLESEIGSLYHDIDFDEESGGYRGNVSLAKITDRVMKAAGKARKSGSERAKTDVVVKQSGKVVTSGKNSKTEVSESTNPATAIAQRIARITKK